MANLFDYIKEYGTKTFDEVPFNEVDNLILCSLSYVDIKKYMPKKRFSEITLKEVGNLYFNKFKKRKYKNDIIALDKGIKTFRSIRNTKRFRNIKLYNYVYKANKNKQFCAMTIKLKDDLTYVLYEGTDHLISGWEEDFKMSYMFPVPAQKDAIRYLNRTIRKSDYNIIVGGHSKGGNLALVASMYTHNYIRKRIRKIYNNDGPGLRNKQFLSERYKNISYKLINIIPNYSIVGLLLRHDDFKIVKSPRITILSHDLTTWEVKDTNLLETKLSAFSQKFDLYMKEFLEKHSDYELKKYVKALFDILRKLNIDNLEDIKAYKLKNMKKIVKEAQNLDSDTKEILIEFANFMLKNYSEDAKEKIKKELKKINLNKTSKI